MQKRAHMLAGVLARVVVVIGLFPGQATAERILVTHPPLRDPILSPSGRIIAAVVDNRFVPEDVDQAPDLYVYSLDTNSWKRVPRLVLLGAPETYGQGIITLLSLSEDGRYIAYVGVRWLPGVNGEHQDFLARYDLQTGTRHVIRDNAFDPFAQPVMSRDGSTFGWIGANNAVLVGTVGQPPVAIGQACPTTDRICPASVALTAPGDRIAYAVVSGGESTVETFDRATLVRRQYTQIRTSASNTLAMTGSGSQIASIGVKSVVFDVAAERVLASGFLAVSTRPVITDDGAYIKGGFLPPGAAADVFDVRLQSPLFSTPRFPMPANPRVCCLVGLSATGRIGLGNLQHGETALVDLDGDADGLYDPWEEAFGLDSSDPDDVAADDDGDGVINADEFRLRSHPFGRYQRTFAEGVTSTYFDTVLHLFRPRLNGQGIAAPPVITYLGDNGRRLSRPYQPPFWPESGPFEIRPPAELGTGQYSVIVESPWPVAVERITRWGSPVATGAHGTSGATPSTTWYFAEGATIGGFQLFYLLANPGETRATVEVDYLKAAGGLVTRRYDVVAGGRRTVWVNQEGDGLGSAEVAARIRSSRPIVAERAMYLAGPGGFAGGTASMGAPAPATRWLFAEGATGPLFDAFLLLANPSQGQAQAEITFRLPEGQSVTRVATIPPESRVTVWVDQEDRLLADTAFSTVVNSDVPIVAERAMWWRTPSSAGWVEGHTEIGATAGATQWAVAEMPESAFLLIANASSQPGQVLVTYYSEAGGGAGSRTYALPASGRVTAWPAQDNPLLPAARYRAVVESLPMGSKPAVPVVVERAAYSSGLGTGTVYLGTPVP
ncbi:hypothetical protein LuPra_04222 [Luteitalea pratensis]|uniref:EF-hand domain-containing protein n=1 Tax=Luteitalea pratensis TaxID=1855912 RepID=A0A143PS51_LUTPR|nr:DUF5719 family protein [Luteitalea pratensis]AMY10978.1 hypothetical protein LuPra_04222 [Luteitalea pratensis]